MAQHKIAKISDIPEGQGKTFTVEGQEVAVFNIKESSFLQ